MYTRIVIFAAFTVMSSAFSQETFVSKQSSEAVLEFSGAIKTTFKNAPDIKKMRLSIENQLRYLVGPMSLNPSPGVPKGDHEISNIKVLAQKGDLYTISYRYKGTAIIANGPDVNYDVILPFNPATIFRAGQDGQLNPCTDSVYKTENAFWYFWSPRRPGCKMQEDEDYYVTRAKISRFKNTQRTYPEYQNLPNEKGLISVDLFFGMNRPTEDRDPLQSKDINAANYRDFRNFLLNKGYVANRWSEAMIKSVARRTNDTQLPYVETINKGRIQYRLFFGTTGMDEGSLAFYWFYKDAIEHSSAMFYAGHSGLGSRLVLTTIEDALGEKIKFNKAHYQIFFFNGCSSYRYYSRMYFNRKKSPSDPKGTKKLDIMSTGLFTYFDYMNTPHKAFADAIESAIRGGTTGKGLVSYQEMVQKMDTSNLFSISGDEDNSPPTSIYH